MTDSALLTDITNKIVEHFHPRRIVLFGSHARGEAEAESDLDLFIEMETAASPPERAVEVSSIFGLRPWSMDLVVYTPAEVEKLRGVHGTLLSLIEAEGKPLYERSDI
jgi:predicted nucleotidyltransferase